MCSSIASTRSREKRLSALHVPVLASVAVGSGRSDAEFVATAHLRKLIGIAFGAAPDGIRQPQASCVATLAYSATAESATDGVRLHRGETDANHVAGHPRHPRPCRVVPFCPTFKTHHQHALHPCEYPQIPSMSIPSIPSILPTLGAGFGGKRTASGETLRKRRSPCGETFQRPCCLAPFSFFFFLIRIC